MGRYRHEDEPENTKCSDCDAPIWARQGVYTSYHGKGHLWNSFDKHEPCSYDIFIEGNVGTVCTECWKKYEKEEELCSGREAEDEPEKA